jgi:hypothetical protein
LRPEPFAAGRFVFRRTSRLRAAAAGAAMIRGSSLGCALLAMRLRTDWRRKSARSAEFSSSEIIALDMPYILR